MASKNQKNVDKSKKRPTGGAHIANAGVVVSQPITETLTKNFMPYAMSVIFSRAIPEIDGFKPSHRKLLYTMYLMGLLNGPRTKSANVVGQTMRLNPHGNLAIYETMVRLSRGYEALLHPYVDSKGNFGKSYSRDMAFAAERYTEVKLASISGELFEDIGKETVNFVNNYDNTMLEPTLLPVSYPSVLVNANMGIAVGMASSISPFNLTEVCETTIAILKDSGHTISDTLLAPDFPGGGQILFDPEVMRKIYDTGRGSIRVRAKYHVDKANNCIEVTEIPPTTTVEVIMDKIVDLVKVGKIREISDQRDETDLSGLKLAIDFKRGVDPDKLMQKLFKLTPLEDSFSCNFNILIGGTPKVMGVREIISEWIKFREGCVSRRVKFDLRKKKEKLHLLKGLGAILLDIDKAVRIIRETQEENEVVPNLMIGFGIDEIQADYVAEIKLRHLNRAYILKRTEETSSLVNEIAEMEDILKNPNKIRSIIISELKNVIKKYGQARKSEIIHNYSEADVSTDEEESDYSVHVFLTREGYFKKTTPQSLRMSGEQKLKEGDEIRSTAEISNNTELLFFTDKGQVYKARASDFDDGKISQLGDYLPAKLEMDDGENVVYMVTTADYKGFMLFFYKNGKTARVPLSSYETKTRRRKLIGAYNQKQEIADILFCLAEADILFTSSDGRILIVNSAKIPEKSARDTLGVSLMTLKKSASGVSMEIVAQDKIDGMSKYIARNIPAAGAVPKDSTFSGQTTF